jgi:SAM-dependent methyltransferase
MTDVVMNRRKPDTTEIYSRRARIYDFLLSVTGHTKAIDYFINKIPFQRNQVFKVLDAGCGTGLYTFAILEKFPNARITAFDASPEMIRVFKENLDKKGLADQVLVFQADVTHPLPSFNEKFDIIITGGVLEYVNIKKAVKNLSNYLRAGGYFLNTTVAKNIWGKLSGRFWGLVPYTRRENIEVFTSNGFTLLKLLKFPFTKEAHLFRK